MHRPPCPCDTAGMQFDQVYSLLRHHQARYGSWYIVLAEQTLREIYEHLRATGAKDCLELGTAFGSTTCFIYGAHLWEPDALATLLVTSLLRPGGWLLMDDLHFKARSIPGWNSGPAPMSYEQADSTQIGMMFDRLVKSHPDLERFSLSHTGHMGWACKKGGRITTGTG